jgi:hypothetical protein
MGLAQTLILRDGEQNGVLPGGQVSLTHLGLKDIAGALTSPVEEMNRRVFKFDWSHLASHFVVHGVVRQEFSVVLHSAIELRASSTDGVFNNLGQRLR